jgi:hypothetical protein
VVLDLCKYACRDHPSLAGVAQKFCAALVVRVRRIQQRHHRSGKKSSERLFQVLDLDQCSLSVE